MVKNLMCPFCKMNETYYLGSKKFQCKSCGKIWEINLPNKMLEKIKCL